MMITMTMTTMKTTTAVVKAKATTSLQWQRLSDGGNGSGGDSGKSDSNGRDSGGGKS